jgi:hypothetical protein
LAKLGTENGKAIKTKRIIRKRITLGDLSIEVIGRNLSSNFMGFTLTH